MKVKDNSKENTLWLEIDKTLLGMENNLLLGTVYISPENSSIYSSNSEMEDTFRELYNQLLTFGDNESIIIGGDFNARTGTLKDITINEKNENSFLKISDSRNDTDTKRERINQDKKINNFGYELRDICIAANLNILNGRTIGDLLGNYTYIGPRGCSTVDYVLASEDISINTNIIKHFKVNDLTRFLDHRPISVVLNNKGKKVEGADRESNRIELEKNSKVRKQTRFDIPFFERYINSENAKETIRGILNKLDTGEDVATALGELEHLMKMSNKKGNKKPEVRIPQHRKTARKKEPWFNKDCQKVKRALNFCCKALNRNPNNTEMRSNFYRVRREYRKLIKIQKSKYDKKMIQRLEDCSQGNDFWETFKRIRKGKGNETLPDALDLQEFFSKLYNDKDEDSRPKKEGSQQDFEPEITTEEIKTHLSKLKNKKNTGIGWDCQQNAQILDSYPH